MTTTTTHRSYALSSSAEQFRDNMKRILQDAVEEIEDEQEERVKLLDAPR